MQSKKRPIGGWFSDIVDGTLLWGVLRGAFWLFETIPLTTLVGFFGFGSVIIGDFGIDCYPFNKLIILPVAMLIDGYVGYRHAERREQKMMQDFHHWHAEEMKKSKGGQ